MSHNLTEWVFLAYNNAKENENRFQIRIPMAG